MKKYIFVFLLFTIPPQYFHAQTPNFDWQGHRGARGIMPENTVPAFLKAIDLGMKTLELDLAVSADNQLVISHEPWLNHDICSKADGTPVSKEEAESLKIKNMTAEELRQCDCGSRGNPRFPEQKKMVAYKPTLAEMVNVVKLYCAEKKLPLPEFNIEIKSNPVWDGIFTPSVPDFAKLVVDEIKRLEIKTLSTIQSFDPRALEAVKKLDPSVNLVYLIENENSLKKNLALLSFKPQVYSPYYLLVTKKLVRAMADLVKMGVDGIITDYPNKIPMK
jgi:glycerophosphoryl diester phosphodiesterase